jgi:hypothetical protein
LKTVFAIMSSLFAKAWVGKLRNDHCCHGDGVVIVCLGFDERN